MSSGCSVSTCRLKWGQPGTARTLCLHHTVLLSDGQMPTTGRTGFQVRVWICRLPLSPPPSSLMGLTLGLSHLRVLQGLEEKKRHGALLPTDGVLNFMSLEIIAERCNQTIFRSTGQLHTTSLTSITEKQKLAPRRFWVIRTYCECQGASHTFQRILSLLSAASLVISYRIQQIS